MTLSHEDYTVGWICALPTERVAAHAMLDEVHNGLPRRANDSNIYILGRIGQHNVAITCLPEYGTVSAAKAATMMQFTFPSIRFGLLVGIGGGIPSPSVDIRLGDIVISAPTGTEPGVVQYDLGKVVTGGDFHCTGTLNKPPTLLLNAVNSLKTRYKLERELSEHISEGFKRHFPEWAPEREYQGTEFDRLFVADYAHVDDRATCDDCDSLKVVTRTPRGNSYPVVHYGKIASGNLVMKDALTRDRLARKDHFICFEMEAAGLMDEFRCLVVRGISDYSDSHKNNTWQPYAAAVAAAYGKVLLLEIPSEAVAEMELIKKNVHWIVPRPASSQFTGQRQILQKLHDKLCNSSQTPREVGQKRFVIKGIGGSGKSEVCLKFAEINRESFWGIFWIDASSIGSIERGFIDAATVCGMQARSFLEAKRWLENTNDTWLIIMDNADDKTVDYASYFPSGNRGNILMTTRIDHCSIHQTVGSETFEKLEVDDAVALLLKASGVAENRWEDSRHDAIEVVRILAQHALAIVLAGAFINERICTLKEYPSYFGHQRERLMRFHSIQARSEYGDVYATFEVSAQVLEKFSNQESADALELLKILAHLHFEGVPEDMLRKAWTFSRELLGKDEDNEDSESLYYLSKWHATQLPEFMRSLNSREPDTMSLRQAMGVLCSFSIINIHAETGDMSMHPLAHAWAKDRLDPADHATAWVTTSSILALSMEAKNGFEYQEFWRKLQAHVEFCLDLRPEHCFEIYPALEIARIFYYFIWLLHRMRNDFRASILAAVINEKLCQEILMPATINRQIQLINALSLDMIGEHEQSVAILEKVVQLDKEVLDPTDPKRLTSQHELASAYIGLGQYEKAVDLLQEVIQIRQTTLPPTHLERLVSQHELARAYIGLEQYKEAAELLQEVVQIKQTTLPLTHPERLASQHELARAYIELEQYKEAAELLQEVVQIQQTTIPLTHPERLASQHELARAYIGLEQYKEAAELLQEVVQIQQTTLSPTHPDRLVSEDALGYCQGLMRNGQNVQSGLFMNSHHKDSNPER